MTDWLAELEPVAPDAVAVYRLIESGTFVAGRRELRRRAGEGSADRVVRQLAVLAEALGALVAALPAAGLAAPGDDGEWNVAQAIGHDTDARAGLAMAAGLAASGRFPADAPVVATGVPGPAEIGHDELLRRVETSQRLIVRSARAIVDHETDACPLQHPLVGRLRCGEWLLFAGVHDLMHLEQLHRLAVESGAAG